MTGKKWISDLTRRLWDTDWDAWNHYNNTMNSTYSPTKFKIVRLIDKRVSHHFKKGSTGLTLRCHFIFHNINQSLLTQPVCQCISWVAATYIKEDALEALQKGHNSQTLMHSS